MKRLFLVAALLFAVIVAAQVPTGSISGQVMTRDGQPAAAVRVSAMAVPEANTPPNSATALVSIAMTDNEGRYRLENVLPGRYYVMAGFVDLPTYYPGVTTTSGATVVNVLSGAPVTAINFSAANTVGVTVSGRVRRASGAGNMGGQRVAMLGGNSGVQEVTTAPDGSFQFLRVRPGNYQLGSLGGRTNLPLSIVVADKDIAGLEMVVAPTVDLTGNITVEGTGPQPRLQIQLAPFKGNGQNAGTSIQPDGTFRVTLAEGEYRLSWANLPLGYEIKSITAGNNDLLLTPLKVSVDSPLPPIRIVLRVDGNPFVKVSGRVTNPGSTRTLPLSGPNGDIQVTVNPDGTFEIPQALPGNYQIRPNLSAAAPSLAMQPISIVIPNQDTNNLIIALPLTRVVPGIVVNSAGVGVQSRLSLNYSQTSGTSSGSGSRSMTTPADGKFTLEIPVGPDVRLSLTVPGYSIQSLTYGTTDLMRDTVRVAATDTAELRVVLETTSTTASNAVGGVVGGGTFGGSLGGIATSAGTFSAAPPALSSTSSSASAPAITRVTPELAQANLVSSSQPAYPPLARSARVQGAVVLQLEISNEGRVQNATVVSGHALLNESAIQAVRQWMYKPFVLNGKTIPVATSVTVNFSLP